MDNEVLGSQLVKYRKLYHYTQEDIAKYLNIYFDLPEQLRSDARLHLEFLQFKAKGIL